MPRNPPPRVRLFTLALLILAGAGGLFWFELRQVHTAAFFCDAAAAPAAYRGEWFYRLHLGPDGWLLRDDDLTETFTPQPATLRLLKQLNDELADEGVTLVLAAQPPRGLALAPGDLPDYDPEAAAKSYETLRSELEQLGLRVTDLAAAVRATPDYFFKRDHHWTPDGARASAAAVAATLKNTPSFQDAGVASQTFHTQKVRQEEQVGSFGEAIGRICGQNPPAERLTRTRTDPATGEGGALFGDAPVPPIALVGTSNSARTDLNFAGFLEEETGLEVLNASAVGGGPQASLESYLRSQTFRESKPRFIVWEFATLFDLPENLSFYRQLSPSIQGACTVAASADTVTLAATPEAVLFRDAPPADRLYLELSDLSVLNPELNIRYRNGHNETVELRRSRREANDGRFFLSLTAEPQQLALTLPGDASGTVSARLCL